MKRYTRRIYNEYVKKAENDSMERGDVFFENGKIVIRQLFKQDENNCENDAKV
jgi:hypothetical protein